MKNPFGKTRGFNKCYAVYAAGDWEWRVLKTYRLPHREGTDPHARWFVGVRSPFTHGRFEKGDTYRAEILKNARLLTCTPEWAAAYDVTPVMDYDEHLAKQ